MAEREAVPKVEEVEGGIKRFREADDEAWLERAEAEAEIQADWDAEEEEAD